MQVKLWCQALACIHSKRQNIFAGRQRANGEIGETAGRGEGAVEIEGDFGFGDVLADQESRSGVGFFPACLVADHEHRFTVFPVGGKQGDRVALIGEMRGVGEVYRGGGTAFLVDGFLDRGGQGLPAGADNQGGVGGEVVEGCLPRQGEVADAEGGGVVYGVEFEEEGLVAELGEAGGGGEEGDWGGVGGCQGLGGGVDCAQMGGAGGEVDLIIGGGACGLGAGGKLDPVGEMEPAVLGLQGFEAGGAVLG